MLFLIAALLCAGAAWLLYQAEYALPAVSRVELAAEAEHRTLTIDFSTRVKYTVLALTNPGRIVIALEKIDPQSVTQAFAATPLVAGVSGFRIDTPSPGTARIVVNLSQGLVQLQTSELLSRDGKLRLLVRWDVPVSPGSMPEPMKDAAAQPLPEINAAPSVTPNTASQQDYITAVAGYLKAAEQGDVAAMYELGMLYTLGRSGVHDFNKGVLWLYKAGVQGDARAQHKLGKMYAQGEGVTQNDSESLMWRRKAAEQGYAPAQRDLGIMFFHGQGATRDWVQAYKWLSLASTAGDPIAANDRKVVEAAMSQTEIEHAQVVVRDWQVLHGIAVLPVPVQAVKEVHAAPEPQPTVAAQANVAAPAPQPAAAPGNKPPPHRAARTAADVLLVDVTVNGQRLKDVVRIELLSSGSLLLPIDAWAEARLNPLTQATALNDGTPAYALDAVLGVTYHIDRQKLSMTINAPANAFARTQLGLHDSLSVPPRPPPGAMLNYDLSLSHNTINSYSGMLEAVAFNKLGNFVTSGLASDAPGSRGFTRLDSYWTYDLPGRIETLVLGDTVGVAGGWSNPVRYGGIRWGRDFGMRPGFVTMPQISVTGEAALPSTMDVLVNNARRLSGALQPGPFDVSNVPVVTGAGEISLVMRDLQGRETVLRQSYYASPQLLASGLTDFSFESGRLRTGYGLDSRYGGGFGAATWHQGLTNRLTGGGRLELQGGRRAAGLDVASLLGTWAVANLALATASDNMQGTQESGHLLQAGIEHSTPRGGGTLQYKYASPGFAPFGEGGGSAAASQRARASWLASIGGTLQGSTSGGASYASQTRWDGSQVKLLSLSLSAPVLHDASMNLSVNKRLDADRSLFAMVMLNISLGGGFNTTSQLNRSADGQLSGTAAVMQNAPAGIGLGWRAQASTSYSQRAQANLQYNTNHAEWTVDAVTSAEGQVSTRLGDRGTVGWFAGMPFASRPVGANSVAVVKVGEIEGVPVTRSHQVVATTDMRGMAFVPGLLAWQKTQIEIDPVDLPLDAEVGDTVQTVTPYPRSGVVVNFPVKRTRQALLVLHQGDGTAVPPGARVHLLPDGPDFITGRRGEAWLTDLAASLQRVQVTWPQGGCTLELHVPASPNGTPGKIGPMSCEPGMP